MPRGGKLQREPSKVASTTVKTICPISQMSTMGHGHRARLVEEAAQSDRSRTGTVAASRVSSVSTQLRRRQLPIPPLRCIKAAVRASPPLRASLLAAARRSTTDPSGEGCAGFAVVVDSVCASKRSNWTNQEAAMPTPFRGRINVDIRDSEPDWSPFEPPRALEGAPNVLYVVLDDVGFSAMSCYGVRSRPPTSNGSLRTGCGSRSGTPRLCARRRGPAC
jgi:hypothetical protein